MEAQGGGTLLYHTIFVNAVVSKQLGCTCAFSACFLCAPISNGFHRPSVRWLFLFCFFFVFPAGIFSSRPRSCPSFLVDLFHFTVQTGAMVLAVLFLTLSRMGK